MSEVEKRPFEANEIVRMVRAGAVVGIGEHLTVYERNAVLVHHCRSCVLTHECAATDVVAHVDQICAFMSKHLNQGPSS